MRMVFIADVFATWLLEQLADAGRSRLTKFFLGDEQERALRSAASAAITRTSEKLCPKDTKRAEQMAMVIDQVFDTSTPAASTIEATTLMQALQAEMAAQLAPLDDSDLTGVGRSSADLLGVPVATLEEELLGHLVHEIMTRGARGGPLEPLASQLGHDLIYMQGLRVETKIDELAHVAEKALQEIGHRLPGSPENQNIIRQARRHEAAAWCDQVLGSINVDFWEAGWRQILHSIINNPGSLVLTARGGSGKSVLVAHFVRYLLQHDPNSCPVVIYRREDLHGGIEAIRKRVGAESRSALTQYVEAMRANGHRVLFVVDGIDAMIGATSTIITTEILSELADTSCLLATCRDELWNQEFSHLSTRREQVQPLSQDVVRHILSKNTPFRQWQLPVLRLPFFLDTAVTLSRHVIQLPETESGLLQALWNSYRDPPGTPMPRWYSFEPLLTRLAELQMTAMSYEIPRSDFLASLQSMEGGDEAAELLEGGGILWRQVIGTSVTVRLNHDLLDCFNMARLLLYGPDAAQRRQLVYKRSAEGMGWPLLSMLIQAAYDGSNDHVLREVFTELITTLDRKRCGDIWMAKSWAATYVLRSKIANLVPLILECLDGQQVPSLHNPADPGGSRLSPGPCVSQEAASSLASAFDALDDWKAGDPTVAVPVLRRGLERWPLRKRFIEALAKYREPAALEGLIDFGSKQLLQNGDAEVLGEVAEALGRVGSAFGGEMRQKCVDLLQQINAHPGLGSRARRTAIESKNLLTYPVVDPVPEMGEDEIIANLDPFDRQRQTYSDWRVIQRYADYAYSRIRNGQLSRPLLDALLQAFKHEGLFARIPVARCLGQADDPAARAALLMELLRPSLSKDIQQACLDALGVQVRSAPEPAVHALRRWMVLHAAQQAGGSSAPIARALADLASNESGVDDYIVTPHAFEIVSARENTDKNRQTTFINLLPPDRALITDWVKDFIDGDDYAEAGKGWEPKYRIVAASRANDTELRVSLTQTTWEEGASFHCAMRRQGNHLRESADRILSAWIEESAYIPGITSVHCIIVTRDGKVVKTRRAPNSFYSPNCWSISFEEQITLTDLRSGATDAATSAAHRGLVEEFGLPSGERYHSTTVSVIAEFPIVNLALITIIETSRTSDDFRDARLSGRGAEEIDMIAFFDAQPDVLRSEAKRTDLHPTSALRALVLARLLA